MVAAGASAGSSIDGLGIRLRVRGSSVSMKPVSRNSPVSPIRQEIPSVGSAIENTTVQPPLWRENMAIGALTESFDGAQPLHRRQGRDLLQRFGGLCGLRRRLGRPLGEAVQEHVVDHLVEVDRDLLVAHGLAPVR